MNENLNTRLRLLIILAFTYVFGAVCFGLPKSNLFSNTLFDLLTSQSCKIDQWAKAPESEARDLVLITIDQASLDRVNRQWPWNRGVMAEFVKRIKTVSPRAIVLDFLFLGSSSDPAHDEKFLDALSGDIPIVMGAIKNKDQSFSTSDQRFLDVPVVRAGIINVPEDRDGVLRRYCLALFDMQNKKIYPTLPLASIAAITGQAKETQIQTQKSNLIVGNKSFGIQDRHFTRLYDFSSREVIPQIPFWKIMEDDTLLKSIRGKVVFFGVEADILKDNFRTPVGVKAGVRLHAEAFNSILGNNYIRELQPIGNAGLFMVISLIISLLLAFVKRLKAIVLSASTMVMVFCATQVVFWKYKLFIDTAFVLLCGFFTIFLYIVKGDLSSSVQIEKLRKKSSQDALTGLLNIASFKEESEKIILRNRGRENGVLALVIFDIDHFKSINDQFGHDKGNLVIKLFASVLRSSARSRDLVARYGGDEFCVLIEASKASGVEDFVNRVRDNIKKNLEKNVKIPSFHTSSGAGLVSGQSLLSYDDLFARADNALYQAKNAGRDRFVLFESQPPFQDN